MRIYKIDSPFTLLTRSERKNASVLARNIMRSRHWKPHCRPVTIGKRTFKTLKAAASATQQTTSQVRDKICSTEPAYAHYKYADGVVKTRVRENSITIGKVRFGNLKDAAYALDYTPSRLCQIRKRLKIGPAPEAYPEPPRVLTYPSRYAVTVRGVTYASKRVAERRLNLSRYALDKLLCE